jgi:nicotinamide riboside kinase
MKKASDSGGKVRLAELLDDESITVENEYVEDEIRKICNHTDRGNFKQKIEDLKKFVIKKPSKIDENGIEIPDEKSEHAEQHLRWFVHCILTKRLGS